MDPRQTEWYRAGKDRPSNWEYGSAALPLCPTYTLPSGKVGMSAIAVARNSSYLFGVWGSDFKLGALVNGLKAVQGGLGATTLMLTDRTGIVLAASSGSEDDAPTVARVSSDDNVADASNTIITIGGGWEDVEAPSVVKGGSIVGVSEATVLSLPLGMPHRITWHDWSR